MSFEFEEEHIITVKPEDQDTETDPFTELLDLVYKLDYYTQTAHLDMGGKHKYAIWGRGHEVITEIKGFLYELNKKNDVIPIFGSSTKKGD